MPDEISLVGRGELNRKDQEFPREPRCNDLDLRTRAFHSVSELRGEYIDFARDLGAVRGRGVIEFDLPSF